MAYFSSLELAQQDVFVLSGKKSIPSVQDGDVPVPRPRYPQAGTPQILQYAAAYYAYSLALAHWKKVMKVAEPSAHMRPLNYLLYRPNWARYTCGLHRISDSCASYHDAPLKAGQSQEMSDEDINISRSSGSETQFIYNVSSTAPVLYHQKGQEENRPKSSYAVSVSNRHHFNSLAPKHFIKMSGFANTIIYSPSCPLVLRNPRPSDAQVLSKILSNPENTKYDPMCSPTGMSEEQASKFITRALESASKESPTSVNLVLVLLPSIASEEEGEVIGLCGFGGIDEVDGKRFGDVGIMIEPEFRGKGYALEALRLSIEFALEKLGVDGVSATTLERNVPMVGLLEKKMGWVGERKDSKWGVECLYKMYPAEWEAMKGKLGWN